MVIHDYCDHFALR